MYDIIWDHFSFIHMRGLFSSPGVNDILSEDWCLCQDSGYMLQYTALKILLLKANKRNAERRDG